MTAQVVAEVLGCDLSRVRVIAADTDLTPIDLGSYSSRVTFMAGNAALRAAEDVKKNIVSAAAKRMNCAPDEVIMRDDRVYKRSVLPGDHDPERGGNPGREGRAAWPRRRPDPARFGLADAKRRRTQGAHELRGGGGLGHRFSWCADRYGLVCSPAWKPAAANRRAEALGRRRRIPIRRRLPRSAWMKRPAIVTIHKIWAAHDCGRALNPVAVEGQVIGSVWMGLGQAMEEEMVWKDGLLMNAGLLEYRSPSSTESPEIECIIVESIDPEGPFRREGGRRRLAGGNDSGDFECDLRRCGSPTA